MSIKLKFGVMVKGNYLEAWQVECINALVKSDYADLKLLITPGNQIVQKKSFFQGVLKHLKPSSLKHILFLVYNKFWVRRLSKAHKNINIEHLLFSVNTITCITHKKGKFSEYFEPNDIDLIKDQELDFIIRFAFGIIRGDILKSAKYGVWSYHHDDETKYRGLPSCFWEIVKKDILTGVILQKLTDRLDGGIILRKGQFATEKSYVKNLEQVHLGSADFCLQACQQILTGNVNIFFAEPSRSNAPIYSMPENLQVINLFQIQIRDFLKRLMVKLFMANIWNIGLVKLSVQEIINYTSHIDQCGDMVIENEVTWLPKLKDHEFLADPFLLSSTEEDITIIAERFDYRNKRGHITELTLSKGNNSMNIRATLTEKHHMSYPYIIEEGSKKYCIPEICAKGTVPLYVRNGEKWIFVKDILEGFAGVDSTVFFHEGKWWLFATEKNNLPSIKLYIWYADHIEGAWEPHALNPVLCDVRSSRPGGKPFSIDGNLYRPTQDCSESYGGAIVINKIETLNTMEFSESFVVRIKPNKNWKYKDGIHTLVPLGEGIIIDGRIDEFSLKVLYYKIIYKIRAYTGIRPF